MHSILRVLADTFPQRSGLFGSAFWQVGHGLSLIIGRFLLEFLKTFQRVMRSDRRRHLSHQGSVAFGVGEREALLDRLGRRRCEGL